MNSARQLVQQALETGAGVLRLMPTWVPRSFCVPGRRLRLHPNDLYALGASRGGIDERWFSSTTRADNGPGTPEDEGLSYIYVAGKLKVTLRDAMDEIAADMLGQDAVERYGGWVMYSKFFDNMYPLPHHLHQRVPHALRGFAGPTTAGLIVQPARPLLVETLDPEAHRLGMDLEDAGDLGDDAFLGRQQDHLRSQRHPPDLLAAHALELTLLLRRRMSYDNHLAPPPPLCYQCGRDANYFMLGT
jgi:hypothetical protein